MIALLRTLITAGLFCIAMGSALAAHSEDNASRQRGAEIVTQICMGCHDLKHVKYRHLAALGFTQQQLDTMRGAQLLDAPLLSATPADARKEVYGMIPPDLSLMALARRKGPHHIQAILTGFYVMADGQVDNRELPGMRMPDVLGYSSAGDSAAKAAIEAQAHDVTAFLAWTADPSIDERHQLGFYVLLYLTLLTALLYLLKRRVWAKIRTAALITD